MSVGADSIKRAAKAADTAGTADSKVNEATAAKSETIQKETAKPAVKKAGGKSKPKAESKTFSKSAKLQTAQSKAGKSAAATVKTVAKAAKPAAAKSSVSGAAGKYEAYGIGQELPVYLM